MGIVPCASLVALVAAAPLLLQDRPPASQPPPPPVGTSRISGQVVADDNGAPVKRASVSISGRSLLMSGRGAPSGVSGGVVGGTQVRITTGTVGGGQFPAWTQVTDDAGKFDFGDLPEGVYSIMVLPRSGFVRPQPRQAEVEEGKTATVAIRLERTGAITGRLLDESGEPLARARVSAMRRERTAGRLIPTGMGATTDDLGQFRLFDLPPGEYFVTAGDTSYGPMNAAGPSQGYAPTYFPGSASLDGARSVVVKSAQETPGIEFSLIRVAMGRITGTLRDSNGQVVATRASVSVVRRGEDSIGFNRGAGVRPDGSFIITEIPPGEYYLAASVASGEGPNATREGAYVPVSVNGNDASVDIRTNTGATVRGRVVLEGTPPALPSAIAQVSSTAPRIMVQARPMTMGGGLAMAAGMSRPVSPAEDGTFELTGVRGPVLLAATGMRLALKSVTHGAEDLTAKPIEFKGTERTSNVTIVLTYDVGTLEGMVTDERGEPLPGAAVIIFPDDDSRWFQGSPFVHVSRARPAMAASPMRPQTSPTPGVLPAGPRVPMPGSFMSSALLPGRYLVAAIDSAGMQIMPSMDRESLEKLRKHAVIATVSAGAPATVQLRVVKAF
jgi:hypothetical protein